MIGIYKITNKVNGKSYIGQSTDIDRRLAEHKLLNRNETPGIKIAMRKYGVENFTFEVLAECSPVDLTDLEIFFIDLYKPEYNMSKGGVGPKGLCHNEKTKSILSLKASAQWNAKTEEEKRAFAANNLTGPSVGHHVSEDTRMKLKVANLGKKQPPEVVEKRKQTMKRKYEQGYVKNSDGCKKQVICVDTGILYESVKTAAIDIGCKPTTISSVLKGRQKTARGYSFKLFQSVETTCDECNRVGQKMSNCPKCAAHKELCEEIVHATVMGKPWVSDKGLIQLAMRTGAYKHINAGPVYEGELKDQNKLTGEIDLSGQKASDKVLGYFAYIETVNGFSKTMYWDINKMVTHAKKYSKAFNFGPWQSDFDAMASKTMLRNLIGHYGIMSVEMQTAYVADTAREADLLITDGQASRDVTPEAEPAPEPTQEPAEEIDSLAFEDFPEALQ
jgi:group I intron endonuclease